jgi:hypothetical protein
MRGCELFFLETELTSELDPQVSKPQIIKGITVKVKPHALFISPTVPPVEILRSFAIFGSGAWRPSQKS